MSKEPTKRGRGRPANSERRQLMPETERYLMNLESYHIPKAAPSEMDWKRSLAVCGKSYHPHLLAFLTNLSMFAEKDLKGWEGLKRLAKRDWKLSGGVYTYEKDALEQFYRKRVKKNFDTLCQHFTTLSLLAAGYGDKEFFIQTQEVLALLQKPGRERHIAVYSAYVVNAG